MSFTINLSPDFNKLKYYFRDKTQEEIANATTSGVNLQYDFLDEIEFKRINSGLLPIFERYQLSEHYNELLYLILRAMAATDDKYSLLLDIYNEKMKVREVAQFLLAFLFIIMVILMRSFAQVGDIDPMIAPWIPAIVFSCIGAVLYKYVPR
ncbi:MAG: hypothetical protein EOO92_15415 [Pedobacter sp.]|nr:MAG: hypothetical protein EOO92_15415 [Pedobacter sp.]